MSASAQIPLIELNDSGVRYLIPGMVDQATFASPGYALLNDKKLLVGEQARQQAYLCPQRVFNQFWHQLSLSPLSIQSNLARHNADLAYAHLQDLHNRMDNPAQLYFAVPGNFSKDQLGILLGLAKAANITVAGLVDAALLSCSSTATQLTTEKFLHLDIQLHQLIVTEITQQGKLTRGRIESFGALGLKPLLDNLAHVIADKFIAQYRFDPLHSAQGEQQLHDYLPELLQKIHQRGEAPLALTSPQGNYQLTIHTEDIQRATIPAMAALQKYLASQATHQFLVSHRLAILPGFTDQLEQAITLPEDSLMQGYLAHHQNIVSSDGKVGLITALNTVKPVYSEQVIPVASSPKSTSYKAVSSKAVSSTTPMLIDPRVTHLLHKGRAFPVSSELVFNPGTQDLSLDGTNPDGSAAEKLVLLIEDDTGNKPQWQLNVTPDNYTGLQPGDTLTLYGQTIMLIEVYATGVQSHQAGH